RGRNRPGGSRGRAAPRETARAPAAPEQRAATRQSSNHLVPPPAVVRLVILAPRVASARGRARPRVFASRAPALITRIVAHVQQQSPIVPASQAPHRFLNDL